MTTVWIYIDTSKDVGDQDYLRCLRAPRPPKTGSGITIQKASLSNTMSKDLGLQPIQTRVDNGEFFFEP